MDVSDKILFYATEDVRNSGIEGVVYKVITAESTFSKGLFTQTLDCVIVETAQLLTEQSSASSVERVSSTNNNTNNSEVRVDNSNKSLSGSGSINDNGDSYLPPDSVLEYEIADNSSSSNDKSSGGYGYSRIQEDADDDKSTTNKPSSSSTPEKAINDSTDSNTGVGAEGGYIAA